MFSLFLGFLNRLHLRFYWLRWFLFLFNSLASHVRGHPRHRLTRLTTRLVPRYIFLFLHYQRVEVSSWERELFLLQSERDHLLPVVHCVEVKHLPQLAPDLVAGDLLGVELTTQFVGDQRHGEMFINTCRFVRDESLEQCRL